MADPLRLRAATLPNLPTQTASGIRVERPGYDRQLRQRICHIGIGRFHRAHQAYYLHQLLQRGLADGWGLCAIGLRPEDRAVLQTLRDQDGLYSLWQTDGRICEVSVIGSIMQWLDASNGMQTALDLLSDADTRIISLTITEAGYCLDANHTLNLRHADIAHDLDRRNPPRSAPGLLVRALSCRRERGSGGVTLMSCDNLVANGHRLRDAVLAFARHAEPDLVGWIDEKVCFPLSMVDRITPAADRVREDLQRSDWGVDDTALVRSETWQQWILEDRFACGRPPFEKAGAVLTPAVHAYEQLKVGLLNGGHSAISHLGLMLGHRKVHEAMADPLVLSWLRGYMRSVAATLPSIPGVDVGQYCDSLIARFSNAEIDDRLSRLAQDTSTKFQQVLLPPLRQSLEQGLRIDRFALAIALWMLYLSKLHDDPVAREAYVDGDASRLIDNARAAVQQLRSADFLAGALPLPWPEAGTIHAEIDRQLHGLQQSGLRTQVQQAAADLSAPAA